MSNANLDGNTAALRAKEREEVYQQYAWDGFIDKITHGLDWETAERALLRLHADLYLAQEESGYEFDTLDLVGEIRNVLIQIREYADAAREMKNE